MIRDGLESYEDLLERMQARLSPTEKKSERA
jgi:hypothetical protein